MGKTVVAALLISAAVSAVGTVMQMSAQKRAAKAQARQAQEAAAAQRRAEAAQQKAADLQAARSRRKVLREARIQRARAVQGGISQGIGIGSSIVQGAEGSARTQLAGTVSFLDQTRTLNKLAATEFGRAREIAARPITAGSGLAMFGSAVSGIGGLGMSLSGSEAGQEFLGLTK